MIKGWKDLFREQILERGRNYFYAGAVTKLQKTENGYQAVAEGTAAYDVAIEIEEDRILDMYCACPYAGDGNYCKHMAAVLFKIEEMYGNGAENEECCITERIKEKKELEETIDKIPEKELRVLVKELAVCDDEIRNMILIRYAVKIEEKQIKRLKQEVDQLVYEYGDRSGFIDYRNAWDFSSDLQAFLDEKVDILIEKGCYLQAFDLTNYVFQTIGSTDIDDSDGGIPMVADLCYEKWKVILENCSEEEQNRMFSWFEDHHGCGYVEDYLEEYLEEFMMNEFQNREMLIKKLKFLDEMIENQEFSTDCGRIWSVQYGYENNILKRLKIMEKLNCSNEEIKEYRKKYRRFSAVRVLEIEESLASGDIDQAIEVLQESKNLDCAYMGLVADYSEKLIDLYEKQLNEKAYKDELLFYVFKCQQNDLEYVNKLKAICTDKEWEQYREQILENRKCLFIQYPLMEAEGLYERLLEALKQEVFIYRIDEYERILKEKFPEQVRDIYIMYLHKEAGKSTDRKQYRHLMKYLKKIKEYPGGKEKTGEIANEWKVKYRRRSAMMDELQKAGF